MDEKNTGRHLRLVLGEETAGRRLDQAAAARIAELSRSQIQRLLKQGLLRLNGAAVRASHRVECGDVLELTIPPPQPTELLAEDIPLDIVYEDADIVVVNKPAGMVVHPAPGHPRGTLVNALLGRYPNLAVGGGRRPGIVHRLDRDTSGLLVVARHDAALRDLVAQMKARSVLKLYTVLVKGHLPERSGSIEGPIGRHPRQRKHMAVRPGGRPARTHYRVLQELGPYSLLEARLETGRTHQIRVHLSHHGQPILGDPTYGRQAGAEGLTRQFLHACRLGLALPSSGEYREFEAPLPPDLAEILGRLRRRYGASTSG
ncbi:MAG: RluA family pseudouridine synthase [Chloroflexia bacterium]|nr:RluA family pseudouridine synthase [Chloroflexia bacterium]